jgi:purine-binding chemotaxis protein CheW
MVESADQKPGHGRSSPSGAMRHVLLVRAGGWICALPITDTVETMRELPVRALEGAPSFVRGVAVIRGALLPVIHLAALLGIAGPPHGGRFVTVRTRSGLCALHVDAVIGAKHIDAEILSLTPPLLSEALPEPAEKIGVLDGHMFAMLHTARILPEETWSKIMSQDAR